MEERILLRVDIDQATAIKNSAELDKQVKSLIQSNKELAKSEGDNSIKIAENQALIRSLNAEKREQNKLIDQSIKAFKSESGSLTQQKAQLALLTQQYNDLSAEERLNSAAGQKLAADVLSLTNNLKAQESAVGDTRRNVGNYSQALNILEKSLADVNAKIIANSQSGKGNAQDMDKLSKEADILNSLVEKQSKGFNNATQEAKANTVALQKMAAAGLQGTEAYKKLLAETSELKDGLEDLKDEMNSVKGSGVERLNSSFGLMQQGLSNFDPKAMKDGLKGIGSAMLALPIFIIIAGLTYLNEKFEFVGKTISWFTDLIGVTNKAAQEQAQKTTEAYKVMGDKVNDQYDREIKIAQAAGKNTRDMEIEKQKAMVVTAVMQKMALERAGQLTDEQKKQIVELTKTIEDGRAEMKVINLKYDKEDRDNKKKAVEDHKAKEKEQHEHWKEIQEKKIARQKEIADFNRDLQTRALQSMEESMAKELGLAEIKFKKEYADAKAAKQNLSALNEVQNAERALIYKKWNDKELADNKTAADKLKDATAKEYDDKIKITEQLFKQMENQRLKDLGNKEISKKEFDQKEKDAEALKLEGLIQLAKQYGQSTIDLENQLAKTRLGINQENNERQLALDKQKSDRQLTMIKDVADAATSIITSSYDQQGFSFQKFKKAFLIGLLDMLQKVLAVQIASATVTSLSTPQSIATGGVLGVTQAAILTGLMNVAFAVAKAEISRAAGGGHFKTSGPTMLMVGDNPGGVEEVIVRPISGQGQTYLNPSSGITHFGGGGSMIADGGYATRGSINSAATEINMMNIAEAIANMPPPILKLVDLKIAEGKTAEVNDLRSV